MDDARRHAEAARERLGLSMAEVSRLMERNEAYYYQWAFDAKPAQLGEDDRERLGRILGLDPILLKSAPRTDRRSLRKMPVADKLPSFSVRRSMRDLPLVMAGTSWAPMPAQPAGMTDRPAKLVGNARAFAVRLRDERLAPIVAPGDELYFDPLAVAKPGEIVAVVRDGRIIVGVAKALEHGKRVELVDAKGGKLETVTADEQTEILRLTAVSKQ